MRWSYSLSWQGEVLIINSKQLLIMEKAGSFRDGGHETVKATCDGKTMSWPSAIVHVASSVGSFSFDPTSHPDFSLFRGSVDFYLICKSLPDWSFAQTGIVSSAPTCTFVNSNHFCNYVLISGYPLDWVTKKCQVHVAWLPLHFLSPILVNVEL